MRGKTLLILLALVAVAAGALVLFDTSTAPVDGATQARLGQPVFPGLKDRLNDVTAISVSSAEGQIRVVRDGTEWHVAAKDGYPANFDAVRRTLIATSDLVVLEARTTKPELFVKLGVEDPAAAGATSTLLTLQGADGAPVASLVVGKPGPGHDTLYVRRATENSSWLARGPLDVPREPNEWIDLHLPKLAINRVKSVTVTHADGDVVTVAREKADDAIWAVQEMGEGMQPSSPTVGRVLAAALESVDFEDVRAAATAPLTGDDQAVTVFTTFDGLQLTATSAVADGKTWFTMAASKLDMPSEPAPDTDAASSGDDAADAAAKTAAEAAVATEAEDLNARLSPWVFALADYRAVNLRKHKSDLVQPAPPPEESGPGVIEQGDIGFPALDDGSDPAGQSGDAGDTPHDDAAQAGAPDGVPPLGPAEGAEVPNSGDDTPR